MASKTSQTNLSEQAKLLLSKWVETFLKWKAKAIYDRKTLGKNGKTMTGNCNLFNSRKPNSIKRDLSQLQGCWRRLKLQSKKDHYLHSRESEVKKSVQHLKTFSWYQPGSLGMTGIILVASQ